MLAIIKTGGKQYKVAEGEVLRIEKLEGEVGETLTFEEVLLIGDDKAVAVGTPVVAGANVVAKILKQDRSKKVWGIKHKPKKREKTKFGHRQAFTEVEIIVINA
jgi:large subunit ribosomal protein L21